VEINPNNLSIVAEAGIAHVLRGSLDEALKRLHRAVRLSPGDPRVQYALCGLADAHLIRGDLEEALAWASRAYAANPNYDANLWILIAANAHLGRLAEARRVLGELLRLTPGATVARVRAGQHSKAPGRCDALLEGLRLAGLPED
jgi:Flp pilus assembly protein TadD